MRFGNVSYFHQTKTMSIYMLTHLAQMSFQSISSYEIIFRHHILTNYAAYPDYIFMNLLE